jgi:hypothetical protein
MNAKQLIEAAKYFAVHRSCECDPSVGIVNCMGCDIARLADHILATVREDDDDPVTFEKMDAEPGWARHPGYLWQYRHISGLKVICETSSRWRMLEPSRVIKNMGHLRRLVAALGE